MIVKSLSITNFKNIATATLEFSPKVNCLLGNNGMGKSNLLDAIYYLSFAKSFARVGDALLISRGYDFSMLQAQYVRKDVDEEITVGLRRNHRKSFRRNGKEYKRLSQHIGLLPIVMVSPADSALVTEGSEERRRFLDMIISQSDSAYLEALIRYNQALEQRNKMLRDGLSDPMLFETVEMMMDASASVISRRREEVTAQLSQIFAEYYRSISGSDETPSIEYVKSAADHSSLIDALSHARSRDTILKYTTVGPHRDDLNFTLDGMSLRYTASQGQTKTFTISLRLAQYDFLKRDTSMSPLLLLDDIFDKLDADRVQRIIAEVGSDKFGQIFITDTNRKYLDEIMQCSQSGFRIWHVDHGIFTQIPEDEK